MPIQDPTLYFDTQINRMIEALSFLPQGKDYRDAKKAWDALGITPPPRQEADVADAQTDSFVARFAPHKMPKPDTAPQQTPARDMEAADRAMKALGKEERALRAIAITQLEDGMDHPELFMCDGMKFGHMFSDSIATDLKFENTDAMLKALGEHLQKKRFIDNTANGTGRG